MRAGGTVAGMLPYLLATHPGTSAETLQLLLNTPGLPRPVVVAALTHPNMPTDTQVPAHVHLRDDDAHAVLTDDRTTARRRASVIAGMDLGAIISHLLRFTDLTGIEIAAAVPDTDHDNGDLARALAANARTPRALRERALRTLASDTFTNADPVTIAVFTHGHDLAPEFLAELGALIEPQRPSYVTQDYFAGTSTRTALDIAVDRGESCLRTTARRTNSAALIAHALRAGLPVDARHARRVAVDGNHPEILDLLGTRPNEPDPDEVALTRLATATDPARALDFGPDCAPDERAHEDLARALAHIQVSAATLRAIVEALTGPTPSHAGHRDPGHVLRYATAHPATPSDLLPRIRDVVKRTPHTLVRAGSDSLQAMTALAEGVLAGERHPGLRLPTPTFAALTDDRAATIETHHLRAATDGHPGWPLAPAAARVLIALEPTFPGTLRELLDTATAIAT